MLSMLTPYRRHKRNCAHRADGRAYRRCSCPVWVDGIFDGVEIRQSLRVRTWDDAERELEKLKRRLTEGCAPADGPVTLKQARDDFISDAEARNLREASLRKYKYLRTDMERFAETTGLRFVQESTLNSFESGDRPDQPEFERRKEAGIRALFLRFLTMLGGVGEPARKLKSPKVTAHPTMPSAGQR